MIEIRHMSGSSRTGETDRIDKTTVKIGRGPGNDVMFDPQVDRLVSGRHAHVTLLNGYLWIEDVGSSNGTYVGAKHIHRRQQLKNGQVVGLGKGGPKIQIFAPSLASSNSPAAPQSKKSVGIDTLMGVVNQARREERKNARKNLILLSSILVFIAVFAGIFLYNQNRDEIARESERTSRMARQIAKDTAIAESRARDVAMKAAQEKGKKNAFNFPAVFERLESSVYPVFLKKRVGGKQVSFKGGGTAWVAADGVLATNAHVAEVFDKLKKDGGGLTIRTTGNTPEDIAIQRVAIHPGYELWEQLSNKYKPIDKASGSFLRLFHACDVALMFVSQEDASKLGNPIPLASATELTGTRRGTKLAFLGYPVEGTTTGAMRRPEASSDVGHLSQSLNFFLENDEPQFEQLLTYNLRTAGGASGSPVFDQSGKAVAVHSAGNYKFIGGRRISQGTTNTGQRVDLIVELLNGTAKSNLRSREQRWRKQFLAAWQRGHNADEAFRILAFQHVPKILGKRMKNRTFRILTQKTLTILPQKDRSLSFRLANDSPWYIAALPIDGEFHEIGFRGQLTQTANSWLCLSLYGKGRAGDRIDTSVYLSQNSTISARIRVGVFQLE